jgi:hypothetical protein
MYVNMSDDGLLNTMISSIYILDFSTIYMAISRRIDPSSTLAIDILTQGKIVEYVKEDDIFTQKVKCTLSRVTY